MRIFIRSFLAFVISCVLYINFFMFSAFADEAELDTAPKTWHGHMSTVLNSSLFTNGLSYENSPVSEQIMKIGMDYGREALGWVSFENAGGGGFIFGYYDENRVFHAERQTKAHFIYVNIQETEGDIQPDGRPEIIYSLQVVNGIDSSPVLTMDESVTNLAIISSDGSEIKYKDNIFKGGFECVLADGLISVINYVLLDDYVKVNYPVLMQKDPDMALTLQEAHAMQKSGGIRKNYEYADLALVPFMASLCNRPITVYTVQGGQVNKSFYTEDIVTGKPLTGEPMAVIYNLDHKHFEATERLADGPNHVMP